MNRMKIFAVQTPLSQRAKTWLGVLSFVLPVVIWSIVSYVPFVWHPQIMITDPGSVDYFQPDMRIDKATFASETAAAIAEKRAVPTGYPTNPIYLPAPHEVLEAFYTAFTTPPAAQDEPWLHQSLWHSIQVIFWGFVISSALGVPLGILCGTYNAIARLIEPFIEFFRYLPAPAFGALAVAILGIYDGPKIAVIVIGTFFQQVLMVMDAVKRVPRDFVDLGRTLGLSEVAILRKIVLRWALTTTG